MKRISALLLCLMLVLLCGCNKAPATETQAPTTTAATTEPTTEPTTVPTEPTEPPVLYRHPLTGAPLDEPFTGRPVAVSIGNTKAALPQHGISMADVFFEIEAEGSITRFLPIFTNLSETATIGPIRSARTFFNNVAAGYNAPIAHCGGSDRGIRGYYDISGSKIESWNHIDQFTYGSKYFFRDMDRYNYQDYAWEHCLFTTGELMQTALSALEYETGEEWNLGFTFADDAALNGETANEIVVTFLGTKTTELTYDANTGLYAMFQYDRELVDGVTDEQVCFKNILVLYATQKKERDSNYVRSYYELIGEGEGYYALDGKIVKIKWSRESVKEPFVYTMEDGTPVTFGVGTTYIGISSTKSTPISYQ